MSKMKSVLIFSLTLLLFVFCICTIFQFARFLSSQTYLHNQYFGFGSLYLKENGNDCLYPLLIDFGLLSIFMLQHSLQARAPFKNVLSYCGLDVLERIFYNTATCVALQVMMIFWHPVQSWPIWDLSTADNEVLWWVFTVIHVTAWATIYTGCLVLDFFELLGVKQVYYSIQGWPSPLNQKAKGLLRLYEHMRHPGFTALTVISFIHPVMQVDRLLLSYTFIIYMIFAFKVDQCDYAYHKKQLRKKKAELQISLTR